MRSAETRLEGKAGEGGRQTGARHVARCGVGVSFSSRGTRRISWRKSAASPLGPQQSCRGRFWLSSSSSARARPAPFRPPRRAPPTRGNALSSLPPLPPPKISTPPNVSSCSSRRRGESEAVANVCLRCAGRGARCTARRTDHATCVGRGLELRPAWLEHRPPWRGVRAVRRAAAPCRRLSWARGEQGALRGALRAGLCALPAAAATWRPWARSA